MRVEVGFVADPSVALEGPDPALGDEHLEVAVHGPERHARQAAPHRVVDPLRRRMRPRAGDRFEHEAVLAGGAPGRGPGRVAISVTIPITNESPVSMSKNGAARDGLRTSFTIRALENGRAHPRPPPEETFPSASPDSRTRISTATPGSRISTARFWPSSRGKTPALADAADGLPRRLRPRSTRSRAPACSSRRRGRSRPSSPVSSASRRSGGAGGLGRPRGRPLPLPARLPAAARGEDEAARRTWRRSTWLPSRAVAAALEPGLHPELPWKADPELATSQMVAGLLDLEADFIAALRQKKKPEVTPAAREGALALARRAAESAAACPAPRAQADADLLVFLEKTLEQYALWCHLRREHPALKPGDPRLDLVQAARDARLPEPRRDRSPESRPCRKSAWARRPGGGGARASR